MFTPMKLIATDLKEMFRSTPAALVLYVVIHVAVSWRLGITSWLHAILYVCATSVAIRLAFSTPLIVGKMRVYSWRNLGLAFSLEIIVLAFIIAVVYLSSGGETLSSGPSTRAFAAVVTWCVEHLIAPVMNVVAYCYILMMYYSTTKTDMSIISIRMDNPRFSHYCICVALVSVVASFANLDELTATLGVFGAYRRYIFETPPKKRVKKAVTKLAEAL